MSDVDYLIPRLAESPWRNFLRGARKVTPEEMKWPRVAIYCPHEKRGWLFGSFTVSPEILRERGVAHWTWATTYLSGDGYLFSLEATRNRAAETTSGTQYLLGDEPVDSRADRTALNEALRRNDAPRAASISERILLASTNARARISMRCGSCGLSRTVREERIQRVLHAVWAAGFREVTLEGLPRRVEPPA